ncbi:hypothetical protein EVAR_37232_1 [Eumeta japonica]|uniref:Uncharacterized protein n=1 Tax=Eumeta variegata TaxID=151549 RepID=A0A4C1Y9C9_EUMVA|nr:hypothetical protein EVAR_37232_1 [Eumeta japonica]
MPRVSSTTSPSAGTQHVGSSCGRRGTIGTEVGYFEKSKLTETTDDLKRITPSFGGPNAVGIGSSPTETMPKLVEQSIEAIRPTAFIVSDVMREGVREGNHFKSE